MESHERAVPVFRSLHTSNANTKLVVLRMKTLHGLFREDAQRVVHLNVQRHKDDDHSCLWGHDFLLREAGTVSGIEVATGSLEIFSLIVVQDAHSPGVLADGCQGLEDGSESSIKVVSAFGLAAFTMSCNSLRIACQ